MTGPLSPDDVARGRAYFDGQDPPVTGPMPVDPAAFGAAARLHYGPPSQALDLGAMAFGGPPPAPPAAPLPPEPAPPPVPGDPGFADAVLSGQAGAPPTTRDPIDFQRGDPNDASAAPDVPIQIRLSAKRPADPSAVAPGGAQGGPGGGAMGGLIDAKQESFRGQMGAMGRRGDAEAAQADIAANAKVVQAEQAREAAEDQRVHDEAFQRTLEDHTAKSQAIADAIAAKKIDANRSYSDSGAGALAVVGGLLGGLYQGINKLATNPFIDQMNKVIDRDIAIQEKELSNQKDMLADRRNGLGQMIAHFKDKRLAKAEYKKMLMTAAWNDAEARAGGFDSDIIKARVEEQRAPFEREITDLDIKELQDARKAAAQAEGARAAAAERARKADLEERAMKVQEGKLTADAAKAKGERTGDAVRFIGDNLEKIEKDTPGATDIRAMTARKEDDGIIPGTGRVARARDVLFPPLGAGGVMDLAAIAGPVPAALRLASRYFGGLSDEQQDTRNAIARLHQAARHEVTGAAFSAQEKVDIQKGQLGQLSAKEETSLVDRMAARLEARRNDIKGTNPEAAAILEQNIRALKKSDEKTRLDIR